MYWTNPGVLRHDYPQSEAPIVPQIEDWKWLWISEDNQWSIVVWCGYNPMLNYNAGKKNKRGVLFYCLNDPISKFLAKTQILYPSSQKPSELRPILGLLKNITKEVSNTNTLLVFDRFYSSLENCSKMLDYGIYTLGTANFNFKRKHQMSTSKSNFELQAST